MLGIIVLTLFISLLCNIVLKKLHLPTIIGYILTGTIIAYGLNLHDAYNNHTLKELAEFGIVFLMFTIGLEFSIEHLKRIKYEVFVVGSLQIVLSAITVYIIASAWIGLETNTSIVIALCIALSSTAIVLKIFNDSGEINKKYGQITLGILIMQDIAVVPILLLLGFLSTSDTDVGTILLTTLAKGFVLLVVLYLIGKYLLETFFVTITKTKSQELFVGSILFLAIGSSYLAHQFGFSYSLGAFIAGMIISETKFKHQAEADLVPFRDLLLGIFFLTVGMQINFATIFQYIHIILLLLIAVFAIKFTIIYFIVRIKENKRISFKVALSLIQIGEFSLAVLEIARLGNLIAAPYGQILIITIVLSMILTPFILKNLGKIVDKFVKQDATNSEVSYISKTIKEHMVILGYGEFGQSIARALRQKGELYIIVENNIYSYHKGIENHEPIIFGNALQMDVLKNTYLSTAKKVIIAVENPEKLYHLCETIGQIVPSEKILVKVHSEREKSSIEALNIRDIMVENTEISRVALEHL